MRVTPMVEAPASTPTNVTGQSTVSPGAKERAIKAFLGQGKIVESDTPIEPRQRNAQQDIRSIQMKTNYSPENYLQEALPKENSAIHDVNRQADPIPEATGAISPQFAALAKQRRALQMKEQELAAKEKALIESQPRMDAADVIARLKQDPLSVLKEHGVTYDQLTQSILQNPINQDVEGLREELKALKEGFDKTLADKDTQAEQQVLAQMKRDAEKLAREGDSFEMVRETRSIPDVMQLIERTYRETGEVLDVEEAMQLVEDELLSESLRIAKLKKLQNKLTQDLGPSQPQQQQRQMRTLTNRDTARVPLGRKARAMAAFYGQLPKQ